MLLTFLTRHGAILASSAGHLQIYYLEKARARHLGPNHLDLVATIGLSQNMAATHNCTPSITKFLVRLYHFKIGRPCPF
jgi:hypothetical protein